MHKFTNGLFIFHRDLRTSDNVGLIEASKECDNLYTCFIFTPHQVSKINKYKSNNSVQFMIESLEELSVEIKNKHGELLLFYGKQNDIIEMCIKKLKIDCVFFNRDYSPYAVGRDLKTISFCKKHSVKTMTYSDYYLSEPGTIKTGSGGYYKKYTPFYNAAKNKHVEPPHNIQFKNLKKAHVEMQNKITLEKAMKIFTIYNENILVHGGRINAIKLIKKGLVQQKNYGKTRDYLKNSTTNLSAYIKFGCVSIREVYYAFIKNHDFIRELIWREFFAHVLFAYPEVVGQAYQKKYRKIKWHNNKLFLQKWKNGITGFPVVDAGMRQMNETGYMHNRCRMIVANFLIKTLLIDWRYGEKYFAQNLTDYDIASNNGNWQGISGTGVDMKPYYRDMNPWIQSKKFDKDCEYIKKWVPELEEVDNKDIHNWHLECHKYKHIKYPCPIVDYVSQKKKMLSLYKQY
jgi:deoxyribodipyrimidine photo-lyase